LYNYAFLTILQAVKAHVSNAQMLQLNLDDGKKKGRRKKKVRRKTGKWET